jgi:hypothetical protein
MAQTHYRWKATYEVPYPDGWYVFVHYFKSKVAVAEYVGVSVGTITNWARETCGSATSRLIKIDETSTAIAEIPSAFTIAKTTTPPSDDTDPHWIYKRSPSQTFYRWKVRYEIPYPDGWYVCEHYFKSKVAVAQYLGVCVSTIANWSLDTRGSPISKLIKVEETDTPIASVPSAFTIGKTRIPPPKSTAPKYVPDWIYMSGDELMVDKLVNPEKYDADQRCDISHLFHMPEGSAIVEGDTILTRAIAC